jgi:hypothetical protein
MTTSTDSAVDIALRDTAGSRGTVLDAIFTVIADRGTFTDASLAAAIRTIADEGLDDALYSFIGPAVDGISDYLAEHVGAENDDCDDCDDSDLPHLADARA